MQESKTLQCITALGDLLSCTPCRSIASSSKVIIHNNHISNTCTKCPTLSCSHHQVCPSCHTDTVPLPLLHRIVSAHKTLCDNINKLNILHSTASAPTNTATPTPPSEIPEKTTRTSSRNKVKTQPPEEDVKSKALTHRRNESVSPVKSDRPTRGRQPKLDKNFEFEPLVSKRKRNISNEPVTKRNSKENKPAAKKNQKAPKLAVKNSPRKEEPIKPTPVPTSAPRSRKSREKRNIKGETELHEACTAGNETKAEALLKAGALPDTRDHAGWTPLHEAVFKNSEKIVRLLLEAGALPDVPGPTRETPLHEALRIGSHELAHLLVAAGASLRAPDASGVTPLALADETTAEKLLKINPNHTAMDVMLKRKADEESISIRAFSSSLTKKETQKLSQLRSGLIFDQELTPDTTHLITKTNENVCRAGRDQLLAVVSGKWIISDKWLSALQTDPKADPRHYQITGLESVPDGARLARINRYRQLPGLFSGCHIYFAGFKTDYEISSVLTVDIRFLRKLVELGGGVVLRRDPDPESIPDSENIAPYHVHPGSPLSKCSHYIIYGERQEWCPNMTHLKALSVGWLIDCVLRFRLVDP